MKRLRQNMRMLALLCTCLFIALGAYFSYSVYFYGGRWFANAYNQRLYDQKQQIIVGDIQDRTGMVLATTGQSGREYPQSSDIRRAVAHVVGDSAGVVANGAETFMASYLLGYNAGALERILQLFSSDMPRGDDVKLTISADLCAYAARQLRDYEGGAIVVLNYKTGEILCSSALPTFDPRNMSATLDSEVNEGAFINRVTQGLYAPGSTYKIVTLASALEGIPDVLYRQFDCTGSLLVATSTVTEASGQAHGEVSLEEAFSRSCNVAFSELSLELGYGGLSRTSSQFGIGDNFLFRDLVVENSQYPTADQNPDDLAWSGIGQGRVLVTPLHMAMIAGTIANDGIMMEPRMMLSATTEHGNQRVTASPRIYKHACSTEVARTIKAYMTTCVERGTGTRAQINGYTVAGKTGSAEMSNDKSVPTHAWFVGFIDDAKHPLAIAVVVERGGSGGSVAAPIAGRVLQRAVQLGY